MNLKSTSTVKFILHTILQILFILSLITSILYFKTCGDWKNFFLNLVTLFLGTFLTIFLTYIVIDKSLKKRWYPIHKKIAEKINRFVENFHIYTFRTFHIEGPQKKYGGNDLEVFKNDIQGKIKSLPQKINDYFKLDNEGLKRFIPEMDSYRKTCSELVDIVSTRDMPYEYEILLNLKDNLEKLITSSNHILVLNEYEELNGLNLGTIEEHISRSSLPSLYKETLKLFSSLQENNKKEYNVKMWYDEKTL